MAFLDTSESLDDSEEELGCAVQQLVTPLTRFQRQRPDAMFAIDNGAFSGLNVDAFLSLLAREYEARHLCKFVAVPDVVASARRTLEVFEAWRYRLQGWQLALVAQDGQEDLPIPWEGISAIFVGGTTEWKVGPHAASTIKAAKALGKWVHVGRVNTPGRFEYFEGLGADSIDGTGISRFSHMRAKIYRNLTHPKLWDDTAQVGEMGGAEQPSMSVAIGHPTPPPLRLEAPVPTISTVGGKF